VVALYGAMGGGAGGCYGWWCYRVVALKVAVGWGVIGCYRVVALEGAMGGCAIGWWCYGWWRFRLL